jgi:hypothetical protein
MTPCRCLAVLPLLLAASTSRAQDVTSGPEKGGVVPALTVFDATGPQKDKEVDYAAERGDKPTVYVFIQADQWDRPMARFLKGLDGITEKEGKDAFVVAVWLTDDATKSKEYLPVAQQSLQFQAVALTCYPGEKAGPKGWNINGDARATVVVANRRKVAAAFGYRSINETDVPAVRDALKGARPEK